MQNKKQEQWIRAKNQTIGVEVEMNNITRKRAAELVAAYFGTTAENTAYIYGYCTWSCKDNQGRVWKFSRDISIEGPDEEKCEMITPILKYQDLETLQEIIRILRKNGAKSDATRGCGVHIHIGAADHTPQSLRNLANIMAAKEDLLIKAIGIDRDRINHYCKTVSPEFLETVNKKKPYTMTQLANIRYGTQHSYCGRNEHYNHTRYHMLNLHATFTKGTVEFRLFEFKEPSIDKQNGLHAGQLKAWIQLCLAMSQAAKETKKASPKKAQLQNPKYAMRVWLLDLGFIGEETSTARKILIENLDGDASWRSGTRPQQPQQPQQQEC